VKRIRSTDAKNNRLPQLSPGRGEFIISFHERDTAELFLQLVWNNGDNDISHSKQVSHDQKP
jgi:hypothetical protein